MNTPKREKSRSRSRDNNHRFSKSAKIVKKPLMIISPTNSKAQSNKSSDSNSIGFQLNEDEKEVTINYEKITNFDDFSKKIDKIELPCTLKNLDILDIDNIDESKEKKIAKLKFEDVPEEDIIFLNNDSARKKLYSNPKKRIIFSSTLFKSTKDKNLFENIHHYLTGFSGESKISDFCFNIDLYFQNYVIDHYCEIDRNYTQSFRVHHYHRKFGKINYHFVVRGGGKSICSRAIIHNYMNFDLVSDKDVFIPTIFFDLKVLNKLFNNKESFFDVIKYELMGIFRDLENWKKFTTSLKDKIITHESIFECVMKILELFDSENNNKLLLIIDHYSEIYDKNNSGFKSLKNKYFKEKEKFDMYVIYDITTIKDQNAFLQFLNNNIYLCQLPKEKQMLDIDSKETAFYHIYELKNTKNIKPNITESEFPEDYESYFGDNISYLFKYKSNHYETFIEFVDSEKESIKNYLKKFYGH